MINLCEYDKCFITFVSKPQSQLLEPRYLYYYHLYTTYKIASYMLELV